MEEVPRQLLDSASFAAMSWNRLRDARSRRSRAVRQLDAVVARCNFVRGLERAARSGSVDAARQ